VTAPMVAGVWLRVPRDHNPYDPRPLATVARPDGIVAGLVDAAAAAHLATVYCHPTRLPVDLDVLVLVRDWTLGQVRGAALVVVGGYADPHGPKNPYLRAELLTALRLGLRQARRPAAVVRPTMLNRYAAGGAYRGASSAYEAAYELFADQMAAAHAEFILADAAAWALWLRAMGLDHLGAPPVARNGRQRAALREVAWPAPAPPKRKGVAS
jgi:hypothetical protein